MRKERSEGFFGLENSLKERFTQNGFHAGFFEDCLVGEQGVLNAFP